MHIPIQREQGAEKMISLSLIATAIGLGLAYSATPGAVNTEALRRGVSHGVRCAFLVEAGSLIGDSTWAILGLTGVTLVTRYLAVEWILGIGSGFFFLRLAWLAFSEAFSRHDTPSKAVSSTRGDFATGVVFGLANPAGLAFWSGLGSSVIASGATSWQFVLFFAGFFLGAVLWCIVMSAIVYWGRQRIHPTLFGWVNAWCGLVLGYFGLRVLWITVQDWLSHQVFPALQETH
jgi:threonine/homoserine/homoserine lactone efflux protein